MDSMRSGAPCRPRAAARHSTLRHFRLSAIPLYAKTCIAWECKELLVFAKHAGGARVRPTASIVTRFTALQARLRVGPCPTPRSQLMPVRLPPGRARLATRPNLPGSSPPTKTIGIVVVAALAANAEVPTVAITATRRRTRSATSAGSRSVRLSAQRYSIATFSPSQLIPGRLNRCRVDEPHHRHH